MDDEPETIDIVVLDPESKNELKRFTVLRSYASISTLIRTAFETDPSVKEIYVNDNSQMNFTPENIDCIVQWMNIRKGEHWNYEKLPKPLPYEIELKEYMGHEQYEYLENNMKHKNLKFLLELINCANYYDIQDLLHLGSMATARIISKAPKREEKVINEMFAANGPIDFKPLPPVESKTQ